MRKILTILLFILLTPLGTWGQTPVPKPEQTFSILFSSNVQGEVEPCG